MWILTSNLSICTLFTLTLVYVIAIYISDNSGQTTAVIIPIEEWNILREKHPDVDVIEGELHQWLKKLIDSRLNIAEKFPEKLHPIEGLIDELNREDHRDIGGIVKRI